jgi:hypothetical protein
MIIFLSWIFSILISACIYPDHFILLDRVFMNSCDAGIPFVHTFALINQFFHGGVQLYDRYDQFSYTYGHMSAGVYAIDNVMTAALYILCSPFLSHPAQDFHHFYSIIFYALTALIRSIGGYLLLGLFIRNRFVIFVSLVYLNTFLSTVTMLDGHLSQTSFSFLPLLAYFILRFFQSWRVNDILASTALMFLIISNQPLFGLGYFYLIVHFFIIYCLLYALLTPQVRTDMLKHIHWPSRKTNLKIGCLLLLGILMILPTVIMTSQLNTDFYVANSGLGQTHGRISNAFKPMNYFTVEGKSFANPLEFFFRSVDFEHNVWGGVHWIFLGVGVLGFSLIGLVLARDARKHIFGMTILTIVLLNVATYLNNLFAFFRYCQGILAHPVLSFHQGLHLEQVPVLLLLMVSSLLHWVNALTNPFSFLLRSFHVSGVFVPYLFLPLLALGLSVCVDLVQGHDERIYRGRVPFLIAFLGIVMVICACCTLGVLRVYTLGGILIFMMFLISTLSKGPMDRWKIWRAGGFFAVLVCMDLLALNVYAHDYPYSIIISQRHIDGLPIGQNPIVEYQNPKIMPYREFLRPETVEDILSPVECYYGLFYQFTPMGRNLTMPSIYGPLPMAFRNLYQDEWTKIYLGRQRRLIDFRDYGIQASQADLSVLLSRNLESNILLVNDQKADHLTDPAHLLRPEQSANIQQWRHFAFSMASAHARKAGKLMEYGFKLPADFPNYLSTGVFTRDYNSWQLNLGQKVLLPVQGMLMDPYTFDVQNVREGWLTVLLPAQEIVRDVTLELKVKMPDYISDVWRNEHDHLGITFNTPHDGWMILHYPYDIKWHLSVDDKPAALYRVNQYFMGAPVSKGEHRILLTYWPETPLRWLLMISMILTVAVFEGLIIYAFWQESQTSKFRSEI